MTTFSDLENRNVLVTGGANGIGAAMVRAFHEQGARVFFCDRDVKAGRALAKELGASVHFSRVDLMQEAQVVRWIVGLGTRCKQLHVLVNNAAADPRMPLQKTSVAAWDALFARNLRAYFLTARV